MNNLKINIMKKLILSAAIVLGSLSTCKCGSLQLTCCSKSIQGIEVKLEEAPSYKSGIKNSLSRVIDKSIYKCQRV
jgi:hypothetical protein